MASATPRRGWETTSVNKDQRPDREKNRILRARQRALGRELRRMFDDVSQEPIPEDFLDLLRKMDEGGESGSGGQGS